MGAEDTNETQQEQVRCMLNVLGSSQINTLSLVKMCFLVGSCVYAVISIALFNQVGNEFRNELINGNKYRLWKHTPSIVLPCSEDLLGLLTLEQLIWFFCFHISSMVQEFSEDQYAVTGILVLSFLMENPLYVYYIASTCAQ